MDNTTTIEDAILHSLLLFYIANSTIKRKLASTILSFSFPVSLFPILLFLFYSELDFNSALLYYSRVYFPAI